MICDVAKNYMFLQRFTTGYVDCNNYGEVAKNCMFVNITGTRLDNLIPVNFMGLKILKWKCA